MTHTTTNIEINKPYWAICQGEDEANPVLVQTDTATELEDILADGSVSYGEEGKNFTVHALSVSWELFHQIVEEEKKGATNMEKNKKKYIVQLMRYPTDVEVEADNEQEAVGIAKAQVDFCVYETGDVTALDKDGYEVQK